MALPGRVYDAYEQVLARFQKAADSANAGTVHVHPSIHACFSPSNGTTCFESYLYLKDWTCRPGNTKERVSIVVQAREHIGESGLVVLKSTVGVSYFTVENERAELLHTIHFDFDPDQENHPVFHAQLSAKAILVPEQQAKEIHFDCEVAPANVRCFKNARIPTSDMTLSSVLFCLAADHMLAEFVQQYMKSLKRIEDNLPAPKCDALRNSLAEGSDHVRSWHWFAHM